jgi:glutamate synthase (NADPH/NADH) small chain
MAAKTSRHEMPCQDPTIRGKNFSEVALGYPTETAQEEAARCIQCKKPKCVEGCPVGVDILQFIQKIAEGEFLEAAKIVKQKNTLPAVCGRVCPQETQCEARCLLGRQGEPVAVGRLERFVADYEMAEGTAGRVSQAEPTGQKVAVIGAGPAGLTCAAELARLGHAVTIFEALHVAGGVLMYGIPEFRLPKVIVQKEINSLRNMGVEILVDQVVGKVTSVQELLSTGYDAVFIGTGAGLPYFMEIPGENLNGVYSANEFLTRSNLMKAYDFPNQATPLKVGEQVAVLGGGNVAMDAARTALRLGAKEVHIVYRRSMTELPARAEEVHHAAEEGVKFTLLSNPVKITGDDHGNVQSMTCLRYELGEPDSSGRRRPVPIAGSEFAIPVQTIVCAIGQGPNPLVTTTTDGLALNKRGNIVADEKTMATSIPGVYAGGDIVTGAATVILAMGAGKIAAGSINEYLKTKR